MPELKNLLTGLKRQYGAQQVPPAKGPYQLILWENACYLLPDERRAEVFERLRTEIGLAPEQILTAGKARLLPIATRGGMRPDTRVFRWQQIAQLTIDHFGGDLDSVLKLPYKDAKKALKLYPNIGDPAAEKILLYCGVKSDLPLESNGLRTLARYGFGREQKNYGATYKSVQEDIAGQLPSTAQAMLQAHLLLKLHGQTLCKRSAPLCPQCPVADTCALNLGGSSRKQSAPW